MASCINRHRRRICWPEANPLLRLFLPHSGVFLLFANHRGALDDSVLLGSKRNGDSTDGMDSLDVYAHSCRTCRYSDCLADTSQTQTIVLAQISCDWFAFSITDSHADFFPCTASTRIYIRGMIHRSPEKQDAQVVDNQRNVPVLFLGSLPPAGRGWSA